MTTEITEILKGFKEFSENPYLDSIRFMKEYIEVEPSSEAYFELGKALFLNKDYEESIKCLEKSDDIRREAYLGLDHYSLEDYRKAIGHFEKFLEERENETILNYLLLCHENIRDWRGAIECGERLLEANPKNLSAMVHLADCHISTRQYPEALHYIDKANCRRLKYKRGLVLSKLKRFEEAIDELKDLKTPDAYRLMSECYDRLDKPGKAVRCLYRVHDLEGDIENLFEIADFHFANNEHEKSYNVLLMALESDPKSERALEKIATAYMNGGRLRHSMTYSKALLELNDKNACAYGLLGKAYAYTGDFEKGMNTIDKGLAICPESAKLWTARAWILWPTDFEGFKRDYEKAIGLEPNNIEYHTTLIRQCLWEDEEDEAQRYYERLLFYNPAFAVSFDEMARSVRRIKDA